jgi:hypothetical protein
LCDVSGRSLERLARATILSAPVPGTDPPDLVMHW